MRSFKKFLVSSFFLLFACSFVFAQNQSSISGIYQNKNKFIVLNEDLTIFETLKNFYAFYYDGEYKIEPTEDLPFYTNADGLFLQFYKKSELSIFPAEFDNSNYELNGYWIPYGNLVDLSMNEPRQKEKLTAYLFLQNESEQHFYEVEYWLTEQEKSEELANIFLENELTEQTKETEDFLTDDEKNNKSERIAQVEKYIKIGDKVYTSTVGRRTKIRNPHKLEQIPTEITLNDEKNILVFGKPDFTKVNDISGSLAEEIERHNSIVYPPRFSVLEFTEPSIYSKL